MQSPHHTHAPKSFLSTPQDWLFTMAAALAAFWAAPLVFAATYPAVYHFAQAHYGAFLLGYLSQIWFGATLLTSFLVVRASIVTAVRFTSAFIAARFS